MKKNYAKPTLLKRQKLSSVTAQLCPISQCADWNHRARRGWGAL